MEEIKEEIADYLSKRKFITLATTTLKGEPLTHPVAYINKGSTLYFSTGKQSRKAKTYKKTQMLHTQYMMKLNISMK